MVGGLFEKLGRWAAKPRWRGSGFTRIAMELADLPGHPARQAANRHKAEVETWLAERFRQLSVENAERTAQQIMLLIEGCLSLILIHRDAAYADAAGDAARQLVRTPGKG
jgi:hypothetical protein